MSGIGLSPIAVNMSTNPFNVSYFKRFLQLVFLGPLIFLSCAEEEISNPMAYVLASDDPRIQKVMEDPEKYELQIIYSKITRNGDSLAIRDYGYRVDAHYFYPASTVKFPIAVLGLEYLSELENMDRKTRFYVEGDSVETTMDEEVTKIFAVSDNAANNRLLELMGQDHINRRLSELGVGKARISHRLSAPDADNVTTLPLILYLNDSTTTTLPSSTNRAPEHLEVKGIIKGKGFIAEDSLIDEPFDFSLKNYYPITTQHEVLKRVIYPELFSESERFRLDTETREFLLSAMKVLPYQAGYDRDVYYDSYVKFFLFGDSEAPMPKNIEIYNKVGYAYGTLTDCAYIIDKKKNIEFLLTATLLVNENEVFNDNEYEYEELGIPFLSALGEAFYNLNLNKKQQP